MIRDSGLLSRAGSFWCPEGARRDLGYELCRDLAMVERCACLSDLRCDLTIRVIVQHDPHSGGDRALGRDQASAERRDTVGVADLVASLGVRTGAALRRSVRW